MINGYRVAVLKTKLNGQSAAIDALDTLMGQLDKALTVEQDFATNAAHELRTIRVRLSGPYPTG